MSYDTYSFRNIEVSCCWVCVSRMPSMAERQYSGLLERWKNRSAARSIQKQTMCSTVF